GMFATLRVVGVTRLIHVSGSMMPRLRTADPELGKLQTSPASPIDLTTTSRDDFPQFLGPERSCWIAGPGLARNWQARPPTLVWKRPIGAGWSAFAAVN